MAPIMRPKDIIHWLNVCSKDAHAEECKNCPYNKDDYESGCGKLLSDAALILTAAYQYPPSVSVSANGVEVRYS